MIRASPCFLVAVLTLGCAGSDTSDSVATGPFILAADRESVVIGETVFFRGAGILDKDEGVSRLNFVGRFVGISGATTRVDKTITPLYDGQDGTQTILRWSRVGPYGHPFMDGEQPEPGYFEGQIYVVSLPFNGEPSRGSPSDFRIEIAPSIAIETWEPVVANCGTPALRGLGGLAYLMKVRAIGFQPVVFRYVLGQTNGEDVVLMEHQASGPTDIIGDPENVLMLNDIPNEYGFYVTSWGIEAEDAEGNVYENILPFTVHRPMDNYTDPKLREAEFFEPVPVSSCFRGSLGTDVVYSESQSETRQNSASVTISRHWATALGQTQTDTWRDSVSISMSDAQNRSRQIGLTETDSTAETYGVTYNRSDANAVQYATTDGENWGWSLSSGDTVDRSETGSYESNQTQSTSWNGGVSAGVNFQVFEIGATGGVENTSATGSRQGFAETNGYQSRTDRGYSSQSSRSDSRSFGSTTTDSRSSSASGTYALSQAQTTTDSEGQTITVSEGRTLELSGSEGRSVMITEGESEAYQRTFTESTTNTTLTSYDGVVPRTKFGIFYRQTVRLVRTTYVRSYTLCGVASVMGEIQFSQWTWAPDLALAEECPPFPKSNLPPAQCLMEPCGAHF
jgi:hypothetical protein